MGSVASCVTVTIAAHSSVPVGGVNDNISHSSVRSTSEIESGTGAKISSMITF